MLHWSTFFSQKRTAESYVSEDEACAEFGPSIKPDPRVVVLICAMPGSGLRGQGSLAVAPAARPVVDRRTAVLLAETQSD